jgi:hypothetical protein
MLFVSNEHVLPSHSARVEQNSRSQSVCTVSTGSKGLRICVGPLSVHLAMFFFS